MAYVGYYTNTAWKMKLELKKELPLNASHAPSHPPCAASFLGNFGEPSEDASACT